MGRRVLIALAVAGLGFALVTAWALESGGIAVVETHAPSGSTRSTHVWYVELDGETWLEAGTPDNPWFKDVARDPVLTFTADGRSGRYRAEPLPGPDAHARVRSLLRQKYGLRDRWVGLLVDPSHSVAVRLVPLELSPAR